MENLAKNWEISLEISRKSEISIKNGKFCLSLENLIEKLENLVKFLNFDGKFELENVKFGWKFHRVLQNSH